VEAIRVEDVGERMIGSSSSSFDEFSSLHALLRIMVLDPVRVLDSNVEITSSSEAED
jgi:hypothetical protein